MWGTWGKSTGEQMFPTSLGSVYGTGGIAPNYPMYTSGFYPTYGEQQPMPTSKGQQQRDRSRWFVVLGVLVFLLIAAVVIGVVVGVVVQGDDDDDDTKSDIVTVEGTIVFTDREFTLALTDPDSPEYIALSEHVKNELIYILTDGGLSLQLVEVVIDGFYEGSVGVLWKAIFNFATQSFTQENSGLDPKEFVGKLINEALLDRITRGSRAVFESDAIDSSKSGSNVGGCTPNFCEHSCKFETNTIQRCVCQEGYSQDPADHTRCNDNDECLGTGRCKNGDCVNTPGSFHCDCHVGYAETAQQQSCVDVNECDVVVCVEGDCWNTIGSYYCDCNDGYELAHQAPHNCTDIDECAGEKADACGAGTCFNSPGTWDCACPCGYEKVTESTGDKTCEDINECTEDDLFDCGDYGDCVNVIGDYDCDCDEGFEHSAWEDDDDCPFRNCTDIDECLMYDCGPGTCVNLIGTWECTCPDGYHVNDSIEIETCQDDNECEMCDCGDYGDCVNTQGNYTCECDDGFQFHYNATAVYLNLTEDCYTCVDIDECLDNETYHCGVGWCENLIGDYNCSCPEGYEVDEDLSIKECVDIDECERYDIDCWVGECDNNPGNYSCICPTGYEEVWWNGFRNCTEIDECEVYKPCEYNDLCTDLLASWECDCPGGHFAYNTTHCADHLDITAAIRTKIDYMGENGERKFFMLKRNVEAIITCEFYNHDGEGTEKILEFLHFYDGDDPDTLIDELSNVDAETIMVSDTKGQLRITTDSLFGNADGRKLLTCGIITPHESGGTTILFQDQVIVEITLCDEMDGYKLCPPDETALAMFGAGQCLHIDQHCDTAVQCPFGTEEIAEYCTPCTAPSLGPNPCAPGVCISDAPRANGVYDCDCTDSSISQWYTDTEGDNPTCQNIDECDDGYNCGVGDCIDLDPEFDCVCDPWEVYSGTAGGGDVMCTDPGYCDGIECNDRGDCTVSDGDTSSDDVECDCYPGYEQDLVNNDDKTCIDIDECDRGTDGCDDHCDNEIGSFTCSCTGARIDYTGYGGCTDIPNLDVLPRASETLVTGPLDYLTFDNGGKIVLIGVLYGLNANAFSNVLDFVDWLDENGDSLENVTSTVDFKGEIAVIATIEHAEPDSIHDYTLAVYSHNDNFDLPVATKEVSVRATDCSPGSLSGFRVCNTNIWDDIPDDFCYDTTLGSMGDYCPDLD